MAISLGIVFSSAMFSSYDNVKVMTSDGNIYLLQYGSYINQDVMEENIYNLDNYLVYEEDDKFYVFLGCFTQKDNAFYVQKMFKDNQIYTYLKNDYLSDSTLYDSIAKLENNLLSKKDEEIIQINQEILELLKMSVF